MRGFVGRINHRDAVLANLNALLLAYPPKRQFGDDFPELKARMRSDFEAGVSPASSALQIAEAIVRSFLQQLTEAERATVLSELLEGRQRGFGEIAGRRVEGQRDPPRDAARFATELTGVAIFMAGRMAEEGGIARRDAKDFTRRLAALLGGDASALGAAFGLS